MLLYHASFYMGPVGGVRTFVGIFDARFGIYGVAVFFAISGFLMAHLIKVDDPWTFLSHRIVRIYPMFLIVTATAMLLGQGNADLISLTLAPVGLRTYPLHVEWTLVFECTYYIFLFLLASLGLTRFLNTIAIGWLFLIAAAHSPWFPDWSDLVLFPAHSILLSSANVAFAGGLLLPSLLKRRLVPLGSGVLIVALSPITVAYGLTAARWIAALAALCLVADAVRLASKIPSIPILARLGDWSYALYLCHPTVILLIYSAPYGGGRSKLIIAMAAALVISSVFGMLDVWLYGRLKRLADAADARWRMVLVSAYAAIFIGATIFAMAT